MQYTDRLNIIYEPPVTLREQPAEGRAHPPFCRRCTIAMAASARKRTAGMHIYALCGSKIF